MSERKKPHLFRGIVAGLAGGLAAAWVMNQFMEGPGQKLQQSLQSNQGHETQTGNGHKEDATMKAADKIVSTATGGRHLSHEQREQAGSVVHYGFGALMGALYGGMAEYSSEVTTGFGSAFGSALFTGADLIVVPGFRLSPSIKDQPKSLLATPAVAHIVYGATTELVRRLVREIL